MKPKVIIVLCLLVMSIYVINGDFPCTSSITATSSSSHSPSLASSVASYCYNGSSAGDDDDPNDPVVCTFYRSKNRITCHKGGIMVTCTTLQPITEKDETKDSGPTPIGTYLIKKRRNRKGVDWYDLHPKKKGAPGYYDYCEGTENGRVGLGLHPGKLSAGCVTVNAPNYNNDPCWKIMRALLDCGKLKHDNVNFVGYLLVVK